MAACKCPATVTIPRPIIPAARTDRTVEDVFVCVGAMVKIVFVNLLSPVSRHTRRDRFIAHGWSPGLRIDHASLPSRLPSGVIAKHSPHYSRGGGCGFWPPDLDRPFPHSHFIPLKLSFDGGEPYNIVCAALYVSPSRSNATS